MISVLLPAAVGNGATPQSDRSAAVRFVDGLRARRLFALADRFCREEVAHLAAANGDPIDLALSWIQVHVDRARDAEGEERAAAWSAAHRVADDVRQKFASSPRIILVALQDALTTMAQAQTLRDEWEISTSEIELQTRAAELYRHAVGELNQVARQIDSARAKSRPTADAGQLHTGQWLALANHVALEQARCFQGLAMLLADEARADRIDALSRVDRQLGDLLGRLTASDPLWWEAQLLRSACRRGLGQLDQAVAIWESFAATDIPDQFQTAWWREQIRLALASDSGDRLLPRADELEQRMPRDPELGLALVELYIAAGSRQTDPPAGPDWQQRAADLITAIGKTHGGYWARRAGRVAAGAVPAKAAGAPSALIAHLADEALRQGKPDEALRLLDSAAENADARGDTELSFELAYRAGLVEQQRQAWQAASDRFRLLAARFPAAARAPDAHLLAAWNLAQSMGDDRSRLPTYVELLQAQIARWPQSPTAAEAALWLAPIQSLQGDYDAALATLTQIPAESPQFVQAASLANSISRQWLRRTARGAAAESVAVADSIDQRLESWLNPPGERPAAQQVAALQLELLQAQVRLAYLTPNLERTVSRCEEMATAFRAAGESAAAESAAATSLLAALASENAASFAGGVPPPIPADLLWLAAWRRSLAGDRAAVLARWVLARVEPREFLESLPAAERPDWRLAIVEAHWHSGDLAAALESARPLLEEFPRDLPLRQKLARILGDSTESGPAQFALSLWRAIAAGTSPQSDDWFEAKYHVARLLAQTGHRDDAETMLKYLQAVPPGWTNSSRAADFDQLLRELSH